MTTLYVGWSPDPTLFIDASVDMSGRYRSSNANSCALRSENSIRSG